MTDFEKIPMRVRDYLVNWSDENHDMYREKVRGKSLHLLTKEEIISLFSYASAVDCCRF